MQFGAHVSSAGGIDTAIDRIEAIGGDCVQVFTQSPRMWRPTAHKPEAVERFKARRAEAGHRRRRLPRALPLQPRRARRGDLREVDRGDVRDDGHGGARSRPTPSSSTSARTSGAGFDGGPRAGRLGARASPRALRRRHLAADGELGRRRRHDRPLARTSSRRSSTRSTATRDSGSASTRATSTPRATTSPTRRSSTTLVAELDDDDRARPPARAPRERQHDPARLEPRPPREHPRGRDRARASARSSRIRRSRGSAPTSRCAGDGLGPGRGRASQAARAPRPLDEAACAAEPPHEACDVGVSGGVEPM